MVEENVAKIRAAHPEMGDTPVPADLVTSFGSAWIRRFPRRRRNRPGRIAMWMGSWRLILGQGLSR